MKMCPINKKKYKIKVRYIFDSAMHETNFVLGKHCFIASGKKMQILLKSIPYLKKLVYFS